MSAHEGLHHIGQRVLEQSPTNLDEVLAAMLVVIDEFREKYPHVTLAMISGALNSDGPEHRQKHADHMMHTVRRLQLEEPDYAFFCSEMVFTDELNQLLTAAHATYEDKVNFWPRLLASQKIGRIDFLPSWPRSIGATAEHNAAVAHQLDRRYLPE